jgi:hypothetical protein
MRFMVSYVISALLAAPGFLLAGMSFFTSAGLSGVAAGLLLGIGLPAMWVKATWHDPPSGPLNG